MFTNKAKYVAVICLFALQVLLCVGCAEESGQVPRQGAVSAEVAGTVAVSASVEDYLPLRVGKQDLQVQLALSTGEQSQGLMNRDKLPEHHGMLFLFRKPQQMSFWMRNTRIPLDIGYFTQDGVLREVHALQPFDETPVRSERRDILFALEMNQGWFIKQGVRPGMEMDLELLRAAIRARGREPILYGLEE